MAANWKSVMDRTEQWPQLRTRRGARLAYELQQNFIAYVDKTLHWLDYFVMDPRWLNLTAVNYAANAAREAASEVRQSRTKFEEEYELTRDHLATSPVKTEPASEQGEPAEEPDKGKHAA